MKVKKLLFYLLAGLFGGCLPVMSLHPLFTEETIVFEEKLLGIWVDDPNDPETTWEFKQFNKQKEKYKKERKQLNKQLNKANENIESILLTLKEKVEY